MQLSKDYIKTEIVPFVGFDRIKLGQTLGQTELLLGRPSEINKEIFPDDSLDMILEYHHIGVDLSFSTDDEFRLGTITFYSKDFLLKGIPLIGLEEEEFLRKGRNIYSDLKLDDNFTDIYAKDYSANSNGLTFWVQDGVVNNITIFPNYEADNNTPIWPS